MVSYNRLWETMEKRKISQYRLIKEFGLSSGQMSRLKKNTYVSTHTLETLCRILDCRIEDVMEVSFEDEKSEKQVHGLLSLPEYDSDKDQPFLNFFLAGLKMRCVRCLRHCSLRSCTEFPEYEWRYAHSSGSAEAGRS